MDREEKKETKKEPNKEGHSIGRVKKSIKMGLIT